MIWWVSNTVYIDSNNYSYNFKVSVVRGEEDVSERPTTKKMCPIFMN